MAADPVRVENARAWVQKARTDLARVERILSAQPPDLEDALFHCQQAAEKALKGFLTWHDEPFRKTHDLDTLAKQCSQIDPTLSPLLDQADRLTQYAWLYRYPADLPEPTEREAAKAFALAGQLVHAILLRLPEQART